MSKDVGQLNTDSYSDNGSCLSNPKGVTVTDSDTGSHCLVGL